ncbi:uncharacterized protein LOC131954302 [Physella acuta]|uniref:uncharacterized protein LOC131954302 n=1 Tax=Physella acuta TaxID=109671 RepID=UPI0027DE0E98|nr:uncharacterized protein LOC131954302 [Physella acuta]
MVSLACLAGFLLVIICKSNAEDQAGVSSEYSEAFVNLLYVFNGNFTDRLLVEAYKNINDPDVDVPHHVAVVSIPVWIPALGQAVTYLYEEYFKKTLLRRLICVLWELSDGEIFMQPYNITSPPNDMSKIFTLDQVGNLTYDDLRTRMECRTKFERKGTHTFKASVPDCDDKDGGVIPKYFLTWSCNSLVAVANNPSQDEYSAIPIVTVREGPRYPFPPYMNGIENRVTCE